MSTFHRVTRTCSVCGEESRQAVLMSTNSMGSPDLDLRPPEMKRSTMPWWVQACPSCGYVARDLSDPAPVDRAWMQEASYATCDGVPFRSRLAQRFYRLHLINKKLGKHGEAFRAALYAAWDCDDAGEREQAVFCRKQAIPELKRFAGSGEADESLLVQYADILRRAGMFDEVIRQFSDVELSEELLNKLILFEIEKAKQGDDGCYRVSDVLT